MHETWVGSLGWEDPLEESMATHSSILSFFFFFSFYIFFYAPIFLPGESPWTEKPGGPQSIQLHRVGHD